MQDLTGHSIGRYHILEPLGQGGMASVYKAFDTRLEAEVAVKVIRTDMFPPAVLERMLKRFEREAKAVARLNHPNIVSVIDYGEYEGFPYLVMKYMPGGTLKAHMGQPMPYNQAARILAPIARALAYAHGQGVLHRDVKPANILITQSGEPVLTDFGIAKLVENEKGQTLTGTGMGIGTPEYMAPEQGLAQEVDGRADVYALGVVFYELVTGRRPFMADTPMAVLLKQVNDPLPRPKDFISALPKDAEQVILKALAKNPADRYEDMSAFAAALEKLAAGSTQQDSQTMLQRNQKKPSTQNMPAEAETYDQMDTGTLSRPSSRAPHNKKGKWLLVGLAAVALIGAGVYFGILRRNQLAAVQSEPVVVTQVVTPEPIVRVVEPTKITTPTIAPTTIPPEFAIEDIPVYDDFEDGVAGNFSVMGFSKLKNYSLVEENGKVHIQAQGDQSSTYKAMFYYLNETRPIQTFFILVHINEKSSNGVVSLTYTDYSGYHNLGINAQGIYIDGANTSRRKYISGPIKMSDTVLLGVSVKDGEAFYYLNEKFVGRSKITGRIRSNDIGLEVGFSGSGRVDVEIEEVRILFDE